jgi:predicted RNA-binding Zn-ribbon protein involved in translation (DUF1610 family)
MFTLKLDCPNCGDHFEDARSEIHPDTKFSCPKCGLGFALPPEEYRKVEEYVAKLSQAITEALKPGGK